tara:strand:- start:22 stop:417 length:396 start_codon:yes stop_codon:yes gene_type:complete
MKKIFLFVFLVLGIIASACTQQNVPEVHEDTGPSELDSFAKCLNENGLKMYGQYTCGVCRKQRELFGSSFQYIGEIECHPKGENPQTQLCLERDIMKTPTWLLEKDGQVVERLVGFQTLEILSEVSGCSLD